MSFLVWCSSFAATPKNSSFTFTDTDKDNYQFSVKHFQQDLFLEDVSVNFISAEEICQPELDPFTSSFYTYKNLPENYVLPIKKSSSKVIDGKQKILQQLFPFHFFF